MENEIKSTPKPKETLENHSASGNQIGQSSLQSVLLQTRTSFSFELELKLENINDHKYKCT